MHLRKSITCGAALAVMALALAACGSSKAPGVVEAPGGPTAPSSGAQTVTATTPTTVNPPIPPALAKKPTVSVPKGAPPKNLVIKDLIKGTGKTAKAGNTVTVNYVAVLYKNGQQFGTTWTSGPHTPFQAQLTSGPSGVIQGWVKGVPGMKVGGRRELIIPPSLGYGSRAAGSIPPNSTLVFVIDLLAVS